MAEYGLAGSIFKNPFGLNTNQTVVNDKYGAFNDKWKGFDYGNAGMMQQTQFNNELNSLNNNTQAADSLGMFKGAGGFNTNQTPVNGNKGAGGDTTLGLANSTWSGIGTGVQIGTDVLNTITGMKQLGLQEDAFNFNKQMAEKEYAMAKDDYDRQVKRATSIGSQMQAGKVE